MIREYKIILPKVGYKDITGDLYVGSFLFEDTDDKELLENRAVELYPSIRNKVFKIETGEFYTNQESAVYETKKLYIVVDLFDGYVFNFEGEVYLIRVYEKLKIFNDYIEPIQDTIILGYSRLEPFIRNELNDGLSDNLKFDLNELIELD